MPAESTTFDRIIEVARSANPRDVRLFLITREVRPGVSKNARQLGKYDYVAHRVDIATDLQELLISGLTDQLDKYRDLPVGDYKVVDDDQEKVVRYDIGGRDFAFMSVLRQQMLQGPDIPPVVDLHAIQDNVWAYCIMFGSGSTCYALRKLSRGWISVDRVTNPGKRSIRRYRARFDTKTAKLEPVNGQMIFIDTKIDAVYADDCFYVLNKSGFERAVGLEDEYLQAADEFLDEIERSNAICVLEEMRDYIQSSIRVLKRLANIASDPNYRDVSPDRRAAWEEICKRRGYELRVQDGKVLIENRDDLDLIIKLLEDYFLTSPQTQADYGAVAKKRL